MNEKRNKRLLIVFAVLTGLVVISLWLTSDRSGYEIEKNFYNEGGLQDVDRIVIEAKSGTIDLRYVSGRWRVNDEFPADRSLVEVLFATLQQAEPKRPVATSMQDSIAEHLRSNAVKVSLYRQNDAVQEFYAGGNTSKTQAFFLKKGETTPHVMTIPGYRVYVSGIFELPASKWREKMVFDFNWTNFRQLETSFRNPEGNFIVELNKTTASIQGMPEADTAKLNTFLDQLSLLVVDEYLEKTPGLDSLAQTQPLASFRITDVGGRTYDLRVYALENQFVGITGSEIFARLPDERIVPLLRSKQFFIKR